MENCAYLRKNPGYAPVSETKSDIKITCEITLRFSSPLTRRAQINVNYDYYVIDLVRAFNLKRTLVEFTTYLFGRWRNNGRYIWCNLA